jgi:hypothetical protein
MKPQSCKQKGRKFQQEIAQSIKDTFPVLRDNDVKSVSMGAGGEDIVMSPLAEELFHYSIECKCVEKLNVMNAIEQAVANTVRGKTPVLAMRKNRTKPYAVVRWDHFMELARMARELHTLQAATANDTRNTKRPREETATVCADVNTEDILVELRNIVAKIECTLGARRDERINTIY